MTEKRFWLLDVLDGIEAHLRGQENQTNVFNLTRRAVETTFALNTEGLGRQAEEHVARTMILFHLFSSNPELQHKADQAYLSTVDIRTPGPITPKERTGPTYLGVLEGLVTKGNLQSATRSAAISLQNSIC